MLKQAIGLCLLGQFVALAKSEQRRKYDYVPSSSRKDYYHSTQLCKAIGGEIAMPKTSFEMKAARRILLASSETPKQSRCYYIGLVRGEKEYANFTWNRIPDDTAQDPSSVIAWENGEPDFKDAMEFCVCVWDYTGYAMDIRCGELMPYLCQRKVASDDEGNYLFNALMDRYNRGELEKPPTVETVLHGMKTSDSLTDILGGFLSSIDNGQKVAARGADTQSEGSSGVGTTMLVVGVILALMLLVGVGFYVYKRQIPLRMINRRPRSIREAVERLYGDNQSDPNRRQML